MPASNGSREMIARIIAIIIVLILQGGSSSNILSTLALFAVAAFRLMPATNRILGSTINLKLSIPSIDVFMTIFRN